MNQREILRKIEHEINVRRCRQPGGKWSTGPEEEVVRGLRIAWELAAGVELVWPEDEEVWDRVLEIQRECNNQPNEVTK